MARIFINYRTGDEQGSAVLLKRELSAVFGDSAVFLANTMIPAGNDFEHELLSRVRGAEVLLAIVGPRWLTATHPSGTRALDHNDDWVRREISEAFDCGVRVVPVLINDTERLTHAPLPENVSQLAKCQYLRLRHDDFPSDLHRIVDELMTVVPSLRGERSDDEQGANSVSMIGKARDRGRVYQAARDQHIKD